MKPMVAAFGGSILGATAVVLVHGRREPPMGTGSAAEIRTTLHAEVARLDGLLDQLRVDLGVLRATPASARVEVDPAPPVDLRPLSARIDALEESVAQLLATASDEALAQRKEAEARQAIVRAAQRAAVDRDASEQSKIDALKRLRGHRTETGDDARTHEVITALLEVAEHSESEDSRLDVFRNLHGARDPALRDALMRALSRDPSVRVRKKVAEDLDTFLSDPLVDEALRIAAGSDIDGSVRDQAAETLSRRDR